MKIRVRHRKSSRNRASTLGTKLVNVAVDTSLGGVAKDTGDKRVTDFVVFAGLGNFLCNRVFVLRQEVLGKARHPCFGSSIVNVQVVEHFRNGSGSPKLNGNTRFFFNFV